MLCCKARRKRVEHERSVGRNMTLSGVFPLNSWVEKCGKWSNIVKFGRWCNSFSSLAPCSILRARGFNQWQRALYPNFIIIIFIQISYVPKPMKNTPNIRRLVHKIALTLVDTKPIDSSHRCNYVLHQTLYLISPQANNSVSATDHVKSLGNLIPSHYANEGCIPVWISFHRT